MRRVKVAVAVLLALLLPRVGVAQNSVPQVPRFVQVNSITVKLGMQAEFEDYMKKIVAAANKLNTNQRLITGQVTMGGSPMMYFVTSSFEKWSDADGLESAPALLVKAYGDLEGAKILKAGRSTLESLEVNVVEQIPDMSTNPKTFMPPLAHTLVIRTDIDPALSADYRNYLGMLKAAQEKDPASPTAIRRVSVVGPAGVYVTTEPFDKFADRDAWPSAEGLLKKAYGDSAAKMLLDQAMRAIRSRVTYVLTYRPDLSRTMMPGTN
jgi:hypothetical protein